MPASSSASDNPTAYIGRFAPSPTGPLHAGSLLAALASFLDAKANNGNWLLRIEDVDKLRNVPGAADDILRALEAHGLHWDGDIDDQISHDAEYQAALEQLARQHKLFYCNCTRADLNRYYAANPGSLAYPGFCRSIKSASYQLASKHQPASHAIRFEVGDATIAFNDRVLGPQSFSLAELGDFIVRRRDSLFAYQLAVVVDDARQGVTSVVRGTDLLSSTPWQIALQKALGLPQPVYAHLPLLVHGDGGQKLSKQTGASALDNNRASDNLGEALAQLGQNPPADASRQSVDELLAWAVEHWAIDAIPTGNQKIADQNTGA